MILPLMTIPSICAATKRNKKDKDFDNCTLDASLFYETEKSRSILMRLKYECDFISHVHENWCGDLKIRYIRKGKTSCTVVSCFQYQQAGFDILYNVIEWMNRQYLFEEKK